MYCAPTSVMNVCAYIADHGFPTVPPEDYNWQSPSNYNLATGSLFILGLLSNTSPTGGTGGTGWVNGAKAWVPEELFTVQAFYRTNSWWPRRWHLAQSTANDGLVAFCYGFYDTIGSSEGLPIYDRVGGHCVTLTGLLSGTTPHPFVQYRDPADDGANTTQSPWQNRQQFTESRLFWFDGNVRAADMLTSTYGVDSTRILDGYIQIRPKACVSFSEPTYSFNFEYAAVLLGGIGGPSIVSPPDGIVTEWTLGPELNNLYTLVDSGVGEQLLYCMPIAGGEPLDLDIFSFDPHAMTMSSNHLMYIAQSSQIQVVDLSQYPPDPIHFQEFSGPVTALAFDDERGYLHAYNSELNAIQSFDPLVQEEQMFTRLPMPVEDPSTMLMSFDTETNRLFLIGDNQPKCTIVSLNDGAVTDAPLPDATMPTSLQTDGQGHLFVSDLGILREYRLTADGTFEPHDGPLNGREVGREMLITKSRTNYDPAQHIEGWHNVLPSDDDFGTLIPDCIGDLNADGTVDFGDLVQVLSDWGPCDATVDCSSDVDGDDDVGFSDLLAVLSHYGPCP